MCVWTPECQGVWANRTLCSRFHLISKRRERSFISVHVGFRAARSWVSQAHFKSVKLWKSFFRGNWLNRLSNTVTKTTHGWLSVITARSTVNYQPRSCKSAGVFEHVTTVPQMNELCRFITYLSNVFLYIHTDQINNKLINVCHGAERFVGDILLSFFCQTHHRGHTLKALIIMIDTNHISSHLEGHPGNIMSAQAKFLLSQTLSFPTNK